MVAKYAKNKYCRPGDREDVQARAAKRDLVIDQKKAEAYGNLIKSSLPSSPSVGVYRNLRGDFLRIMKAGEDFMRVDLPVSQQELEFGHLWMPTLPSGLPSTAFDEAREYGYDEFRYILVEPMNIGFNCVATDGGLEVYQRKPIIISMVSEKHAVWEAVSTDRFDPYREYFSLPPDGEIQRNPR